MPKSGKDNAPCTRTPRISTEPTTTRFGKDVLHLLAAIGEQRGHTDRSETIREAVAEYIENHVSKSKRAA